MEGNVILEHLPGTLGLKWQSTLPASTTLQQALPEARSSHLREFKASQDGQRVEPLWAIRP